VLPDIFHAALNITLTLYKSANSFCSFSKRTSQSCNERLSLEAPVLCCLHLQFEDCLSRTYFIYIVVQITDKVTNGGYLEFGQLGNRKFLETFVISLELKNPPLLLTAWPLDPLEGGCPHKGRSSLSAC
jgi:hypothetical protein